MVFVSAPESSLWVTFAKSWVRLKHLLSTVGFEHGLSGLDGVLLRNVNGEMYVTPAKAKVTEFKSEVLKIPERLGAGVDMRLSLEAVVVAFGFKHHGDPVVSCVMRWLFMAFAIYILHGFCILSRLYRAGKMPAARDKKKIWFDGRKKEIRLFICGSYNILFSDHAVFPVAVNKNTY